MTAPIEKSDAEWREELTPEQYRVCRQCGTEPAFSGAYRDCHEAGIYRCVCCGAALFDSETKFDSGSGWPSFRQPHTAENITTRTSVTCFRTARRPPDCASASTRPHSRWIETDNHLPS